MSVSVQAPGLSCNSRSEQFAGVFDPRCAHPQKPCEHADLAWTSGPSPSRNRGGRYAGRIDWSLFHAVNSGIATRDWLEDPFSTLGVVAVPFYALSTIGLWFLARPYGNTKWKLATTASLAAAAMAMVTNQLISHLWDRPRPFAAHAASTHLLSAPSSDPSFPSDHAAVAFAIAFAVLAYSRRAGGLFLAFAVLIGLSRIALGLHYPSDVLVGMIVGYGAALMVNSFGAPWLDRLVALVSRVSDPVLKPAWDRFARRTPVPR